MAIGDGDGEGHEGHDGREDLVVLGEGRAAFSACGQYRWWLERVWEPAAPRLIFIGLNPSRADGRRDDATLRRLLGFGRRWGYGSLEVLNLFSRISPSPALLRRAADPVGAETDAWICARLLAHPQAPVWLGWGNQGVWRGRHRALLALLAQGGCPPGGAGHPERPSYVLGLTACGQPRHPLYVPADVAPQPVVWHNLEGLGHPVGTSVAPTAASPCPAPLAATPFTCT